ncbi:MAG TPA: thiamine diphosphokinase [Candidatus Syntrophosphaera sp.]|nr:thiamine diphosphokinase [Candidatus Syntrophosphaera sp.]
MNQELPTAWLFTFPGPSEFFSSLYHASPGRDLIVAVDNGLQCLHESGLKPDLIIGDMDSVSPELLARYADTPRLAYPVRKNETDTQLAIQWCIDEARVKQIVIVNSLEGRFDHALALVQNLGFLAERGVPACIVSARQQVFFLEERTEISACAGCLLSLLAWDGAARFLHSEGLEYPLDGLSWSQQTTRGISNRVLSATAVIQLGEGRVLAILTKSD